MTAVYLLRHGQASFGTADYDVLSPMGQLQAKVLGDELRRREVPVAAVWSGTMRRQVATADACLPAAGITLPCRRDPRWNEYDHVGLVPPETLPTPADARRFQELLDVALLRWIDGGEPVGEAGTWARFSTGALAAVREALEDLPRGGSALVFTSGGVIAAVCARVLGLPPVGYLAVNRTMVNGGITKLVSGRGGVNLVAVNEHGHFEGENRDLRSYR